MTDTAQLARELAELETAANSYNAQFEFIEDFAWPDGTQIAVNFTADFDTMLFRRFLGETPMQLAQGEFGGRVGIWRLVELFTHHGVKATIFTPGRICELYPESLVVAHKAGHEVADHMWEHHVPKDMQLEHDHIRKSTAALEKTVGRRPVGTRSRHTQSLLIEEGYIYNSHGSAAHLPYYQRDADGGNCLINLPFHYAIDDAMFFNFAWQSSENAAQRITDPDRVLELWWAAFEQQYQQGGYLNVCLHPFVSGRAMRIEMLDRLIARMKTLPGVWFPSCEEVARYCLEAFPAKEA